MKSRYYILIALEAAILLAAASLTNSWSSFATLAGLGTLVLAWFWFVEAYDFTTRDWDAPDKPMTRQREKFREETEENPTLR